MSKQNTLVEKRRRFQERARHKAAAKPPSLGIAIDRKTVLAHRYLARKGFDFSEGVATVDLTRVK